MSRLTTNLWNKEKNKTMNPLNRPVTQTTNLPPIIAAEPTARPPKAPPQSKPAETKPQPAQTQSARRTVRFELDVPRTRSVSVVGNFNNWKPGATQLTFLGGIKWFKDISLPPGRYEYRFVVDGKWTDDPKAKAYVPNPHGGRNAVVEVV